MLTYSLILFSVLVTSILSGVLGMAGGMILMAILVSTLPVASAMMIHGAVQATSNGSRAWFLRTSIQWQVMPAYLLGAGVALLIFTALTFVPDANLILIVVGLFPFLARLIPHLRGLDVGKPLVAACCGLVVTSAQLLAGASGPLLDVFYLNSKLNRYRIIASKAVTQTFGHILKLVYYGWIIGVSQQIEIGFYLAAMLLAVAGARVGTSLLGSISDDRLRRISGNVILIIAAICALKGISGYLQG